MRDKNKRVYTRRGSADWSSAASQARWCRETIHVVVQRGETAYVAECLELAVVTQGKKLDEGVGKVRQAIALHIEDEDMAMLGLAEHPRLQLIYDVPIAS